MSRAYKTCLNGGSKVDALAIEFHPEGVKTSASVTTHTGDTNSTPPSSKPTIRLMLLKGMLT